MALSYAEERSARKPPDIVMFGLESRSNHKQFLVRRLAWRLQANAEGDLSERARLRAVALAEEAGEKEALNTAAPAGGRILPATAPNYGDIKMDFANGGRQCAACENAPPRPAPPKTGAPE